MANSKKNALGKGLNVLIPETSSQPVRRRNRKKSENKMDHLVVAIDQVEPNREQPRKQFNEESLKELSDSIKQFGVIQPLVVQKKDDYYEIIAGERRWRAAKMAGLKELPVIVKEYTENEVLEISLIENIQRENLNPIEEALAYQSLINEFKLKQEEIAEKVSKNRSTITNSLRLLKLSNPVQNMLAEGEISMGHARALLPLETEEKQVEIATRVVEEGLSVRNVEKIVKDLSEKDEKPEKKKEDHPYKYLYEDIENNLKEILGNKVKIKNKKNNKGKIEIEYYSEDDLERIVELLQR